MKLKVFLSICSLSLLAWSGCRKPVHFPAERVELPAGQQAFGAYDTDGDGTADYFTYANGSGRIDRIAYDRDADGLADRTVKLDRIDPRHCRHLVLILDGVGYDLVKSYYDQGNLRLFHAPSLVIAPYPTLTDLCLEDLFGYVPCPGFEAKYYDHKSNRITGGTYAYLSGENQPYNRLLHYRANLLFDAIGYVMPRQVFGKELNDAKRVFDKRKTQEVIAYFVSSAGMATTQGRDGHLVCLGQVERLVNQVVQETEGLTKITLLADHGHTYTAARRAPIERHLTSRGWKLTKSLHGPKDVVCVRFGLETYASFATLQPGKLAGDLIDCEGVELASYARDEKVVVLGKGQSRAEIINLHGRFGYKPRSGDPLKLRAILERLSADGNGTYDPDELLAATARHEYPAPLQRLWRAHFALVENPPDVIVSLANDYCYGSRSFASRVKIASTHGGLNYRNSATFIMSTAGPLPPVLRSSDVPQAMSELLGCPWPMRR